MNNVDIFITINHLDDYNGLSNIKVGDTLTLLKDFNNPYDDEAIVVYDKDNTKIGYVANSVRSVARGTYSAGRLYDKVEKETTCEVCFILGDILIAKLSKTVLQ